jgi:hypothetical protein
VFGHHGGRDERQPKDNICGEEANPVPRAPQNRIERRKRDEQRSDFSKEIFDPLAGLFRSAIVGHHERYEAGAG